METRTVPLFAPGACTVFLFNNLAEEPSFQLYGTMPVVKFR